MNYFSVFLLLLLYPFILNSKLVWNGEQLVVENDKIRRIIVFENGEFTTQSFRLKGYPYNFVSTLNEEPTAFNQTGVGYVQEFRRRRGPDPDEFSFLLNGEKITGKSGWQVTDVQTTINNGISENRIRLKGINEPNKKIELTLSYFTYESLPLIRKKIDFKNISETEIKIESLDVESLNIPWGNTHNIVCQSYGRYKHIGPFLGNWSDPLVASHDPVFHHGIVVGNEAPGVLKRTSVCLDGRTLDAGLTHAEQDYAFRKWLKPGEEWESTYVFTGLYSAKNPLNFVEGPVNDFVRKYLGIRLAKIPVRPTFVYNTWKPFRRNVNEKLIFELADAAAECGVEEFIIDDGWQVGFGDWEIDKEKFPNGLKPVFDYIKSKGMKPGLWLSMGAASKDSKVFQKHPEWFAKYRDGNFVNLHSGGETDRY